MRSAVYYIAFMVRSTDLNVFKHPALKPQTHKTIENILMYELKKKIRHWTENNPVTLFLLRTVHEFDFMKMQYE